MRLPSWLSALGLAALVMGKDDAKDSDSEVKSIALRTHTLVEPYLDSDMGSRWYDFGGDTIIRTDSYIRLTSEQPSQNGWLFSRVPLTATNWEVEVEFKIHGKNQLYGDGFAMWVTKDRGKPGPVFGHTDKFEGLGIFVDTYKNNRPGVVFPYVMAMAGNGETSYDKDTDGKGTELAGCSARGIRNTKQPAKLKLTYFQDKSLKLELQYKNDEWTTCFETDQPPEMPKISYLGFSAETGELTDNHDIISIRARNLYIAPKSKSGPSKSRGKGGNASSAAYRRKKQGGSWLWFLAKGLLFVGAIAGAYVGYTIYRSRKKTHRF
ncbi:related to vesicular integral-membrane protein VIP36 [Cephalotrichum gorgonifer]|uniref:Related to vesicular integral-membrane protein VIP36 n=1 Tax=Cephalotrichum gorgonifer TaxID=2041049 RepID=A0AAE8STY7_9PEZI|nr:related to vesicular integral-membrane protein VIP36 [Cephalotrichum gorgonifer]